MIKFGEVTSIFPEKGTVKVTFQDLNIPSAELYVLQGRTFETKKYSIPKIGEVGICIFPENSYTGFYLGGAFNEVEKIPSLAGENIEMTLFKDGTIISYDENSSKLYINATKEIEIIAKNIKINCPKINIIGDINHTGNLKTSGNTSVGGSVTAVGEVSGKGIKLSDHKHSKVAAGNDKTGGPE